MNSQDAKRVLETALICASQPLPLRDMRVLFADEVGVDTLRRLLDELTRDWEDRGVELVALSNGWRLQSRPEMRPFLDRLNPEKPPKYSRAVMETLAIIAYRQPVTRGDIEDIRGVTVASQIIKQLEDRGWVESIGYRESPGRPALLATTAQFLDDLGLASLAQLPTLVGSDPIDDPLSAHLPLQGSLLDAVDGAASEDATRTSPGDPAALPASLEPAPVSPADPVSTDSAPAPDHVAPGGQPPLPRVDAVDPVSHAETLTTHPPDLPDEPAADAAPMEPHE